MNTIEFEDLELLEFYKIKKYVTGFCHSSGAKSKASQIFVFENHEQLTIELQRVSELKNTLSSDSFFPDIQFQDFRKEASLLGLDGSMLTEEQFLLIKEATEISNTAIRFLKNKKQTLPYLAQLADDLEDNKVIVSEIEPMRKF